MILLILLIQGDSAVLVNLCMWYAHYKSPLAASPRAVRQHDCLDNQVMLTTRNKGCTWLWTCIPSGHWLFSLHWIT